MLSKHSKYLKFDFLITLAILQMFKCITLIYYVVQVDNELLVQERTLVELQKVSLDHTGLNRI